MTSDEIARYHAAVPLRDGRTLLIRAIRADDKGPIAEALEKLSDESVYRRLFGPRRELTEAALRKITEVDFENVVALVALLDEDGGEKIVGGGRYFRAGDSAEVAFLVDDAHQGLGIGSRIFRQLIAIARTSGIARFEAEVLPSNEGMLRLFARSGLPLARTAADGSVHLTMELTANTNGIASPSD